MTASSRFDSDLPPLHREPPPAAGNGGMWEGGPILEPSSAFSKEVFKTIRPQIPRVAWPPEIVSALFLPKADGSGLVAEFEDFSGEHARHASQLVLARGAELILLSPARQALIDMYAVKRWRDVCLYSLLPLLFAILVVQALVPQLSRNMLVPFVLDCVALAVFHTMLSSRRSQLENTRFIARIPTPGLHIRIDTDTHRP